MITEKERAAQLFSDFAKAHDALLVKSLDRNRTFAEAVDDYRKLEAEFVARAGDSDFAVVETRRRVAEAILLLANEKRMPFEVCREAWNELVRLGFTNIHVRCMKTWFYADCCAYDEKPEEGLAVLEPLIAELECGFEEAKAAQRRTGFYEDQLETLEKLRGALLAQQRGELRPERSTRRLDEAAPPTPEE
ncbi:hypothetical protein [Polyangium sorediatum]|uniref:Uncharacterized protein n=1 Tax=Polyangium sorediatum TaxID=889274 RepID=A0ABT6P014_9BACT|nr:hypothetical protein [Polyangium sorediatum]MDI1433941.1 hypothetical protein [Polyangium sorediatum]